MDVSRARTALNSVPLGEHEHDGVERLARQVAERERAAHKLEQLVCAPVARSGCGYYLLS
jgi:hypothetical protein